MKYTVGKVSNFEDGMKKKVMAGGKPLMLALVKGKFFIVEDTCTHAKASLSAGRLKGHQIQCPWHGSVFDIITGQIVALPAAIPIKTFPVEIMGDDIIVEIDKKLS